MNKLIACLIPLSLLLHFSSCVGYGVKVASYPNKSHYSRLNNPVKGWKQMDIYESIDPSEAYESIARIVVLGDENDSEERLLRKLRKEASRFRADALLHIHTVEVPRTSFNGLAVTLNIAGIFVGDGSGEFIDMGGDYYALEVEAVAIKFLDED